MTSGTTEQLLSDVYTDNSEPYLFRKTGGSDKVGSREYLDKIVGGSLAENQLIQNGDFSNGTTGWAKGNYVTWSVSNDGVDVVATQADNLLLKSFSFLPHVYLCAVNLKLTTATTNVGIRFGQAQQWKGCEAITSNQNVIGIFSVSSVQNNYIRISDLRATGNDNVHVYNVRLIDLTAEFGSTIANYVYSLETATAGAGVAWLRQYIDIDTYHPFSEPTLKHVEGLQSHDTTGLNQWDEEWEPGGFYTSTGLPWTTDTRIRSKNFIPVLPDTRYHIRIPEGDNSVILYYGKDKQFIITRSVGNGSIFTTPTNARFIMFNTGSRYVTIHGLNYNHDICINFSSAITNGIYEPYQKRSYSLDSSVVLRGVPTLVEGRLKFDGDEYLYDGTINRRYVIDNLGIRAWTYREDTTIPIFQATLPQIAKSISSTIIANAMCSKYIATTSENVSRVSGKTFAISADGARIYIQDPDYTDAAAFKTAMSGVLLVYEAATPTTETAEPFRQLQICDTYGTESFVATSEVPVGTETRYPEDLKSKIEGLPWDLSMIAPIENGTTASQAYTAGQYFLHNNVFCKALTNIASGATFTLGTNYSETTVAAELYAALH